jgi:dihydrofolate synthase/folylpolyglutamate synthase
MRFDDLDAWLSWQETLHPSEIELGLDRISEVASRMGLLAPHCKVITVAGTNGKGSSLAMLDAIYRAAGYKTGLYTSPHINRYNERIRLNGSEVSDQLLCEAFEAVDQARGEVSLSYFEFGTLAALTIFNQSELDVMLLEVGLGGRLDAVNVIDADVALITAIDIDHTDWLGADRELIGREKAGIMRPDRVTVVSDPEPPTSILDYANTVHSRLVLSGRDYDFQRHENSWEWESEQLRHAALPFPALKGEFQLHNAAGVLAIVSSLNGCCPVTEQAIHQGLRTVNCPGRMTLISEHPQVILDVAHNPQSARSLANYLEQNPISGKTTAVLGMMADKDVDMALEPFRDIVTHWYLVAPACARAMPPEALAERLAQTGMSYQICSSVQDGIVSARQDAQNNDRIIVFGSFFTVAEAMPEAV